MAIPDDYSRKNTGADDGGHIGSGMTHIRRADRLCRRAGAFRNSIQPWLRCAIPGRRASIEAGETPLRGLEEFSSSA